MSTQSKFSPYQIFIIAVISFIQFTVILDFMVLSPLGAILMPKLQITTSQFGIVVSAYAFAAGITGLFAAGFADNFDRKKFLLFFYFGFLIGTACCAMAQTYTFLLAARIVTGIFGGVIGSIGMAIISDLFAFEQRGRVMGFTQMAFAASQILGLPIGLSLANRFEWHAPFWMIVGFGILVGIGIIIYMRPITAHLEVKRESSAFNHLWSNMSKNLHVRAFLSTVLLATAGFMMMPFGSAYSINNLGVTLADLPTIYLISGLFSIVMGPLAGKMTDKLGAMPVFLVGTIIAMITIIYYCNIGITPLWMVIVINVVMFSGITARMISSSTLLSSVPAPQDRGAFMSINSSIQQISGGIASALAGFIVYAEPSGKLQNYPLLGWVVIGSMVITLGLIYWLSQHLKTVKS